MGSDLGHGGGLNLELPFVVRLLLTSNVKISKARRKEKM
jgi:hypothetical protein